MHTHSDVPLPAIHPGSPQQADMVGFGRLLGAALEGCQTCQRAHIGDLLGDHRVIAHAAAMAWTLERSFCEQYVGVARRIEELPPAVRPIATAVDTATSTDSTTWEHAAAALDRASRQEALDYALDILIGVMSTKVIAS
ncbi:hypothetical protein [Nonomuraea sp. NPDC023979]|uniref:hypothetical protein n=1 Tax=Nonomuraea sp. NPDC023979 TaxID=3154796 RepID=UPI0033F004C7